MKRTFTIELTFAGDRQDLPSIEAIENIWQHSTVREALECATLCRVYIGDIKKLPREKGGAK